MSLWLIGSGIMAQEYAKVLQHLDQEFVVVGRGTKSAEKFELVTGRSVRTGGLNSVLATSPAPEQVIIAVGVQDLTSVAIELMEAGTRRVLIEKPGGLNTQEIQLLQQHARRHGADTLIAYNRRFYASTTIARKLIAEDGGATSCTFEFTEWSHVISQSNTVPQVKRAWLLANSTHVIDLAFHLIGFPLKWRVWQGGSLEWHPAAARFCGSGVSERGVFFSYHADWEAPGRWGVEVLTRRHRLILRPIERMMVIPLGSTEVQNMEFDDRMDIEFKPGLLGQTKAFLDRDNRLMCTIDEQIRNCTMYDEMAGYKRANPPAP